jgi:outer membrane protein OmpA-like peptidoglycan-associated protein
MAATANRHGSKLVMAGALAALIVSTGCATDPVTGQQTMTRGGKGAIAGGVGGALLGGLIGGNTGALIGAGVGSIAGGGIGSYQDRQERALREATRGTEIEVERKGDEIQLTFPDTISFDFNSAIVKPELRGSLQEVAKVLNAYPSTVIGVFGHTDNVGSTAANQRLSERRAESVVGSLESFGVARARMQPRGFGYTQPVASNDTPEGRAQNRRVEIRIIPVTQEQIQAQPR